MRIKDNFTNITNYFFDKKYTFFLYQKISIDHRAPLVRWSLHKYKCQWGIGGKGRGSSLQERALHTC